MLDGERIALASLSTSAESSAVKYHLCACGSGRLFVMENNPLRCAGANTNTICS